MALFPLGILSAAGAGGVGGTYELIETVIVSGSSTSSVVFSNLGTYSSTYKHLQLRSANKNARPNLWSGSLLRFNGDTGANYSFHSLYGNGTSVLSNNSPNDSAVVDQWAAGNSASNVFSPAIFDILDAYSTTKNKTVRFMTARNVGGGEDRIGLSSGLWMNTSSVTSITVLPSGGFNWVAGTRLSLYGIRV
jgi:hypothetical protein